MQTNPMQEAVKRNEMQLGIWINMIRNPAVLPLLKSAGLDFARVDMEHSSASMETIADMALLARAINFPIVVRPPKANREWITRLLDSGVYNLHCPQVESVEHAREIVEASRYAPRGLRGNGGLGPSSDFERGGNPRERRALANEQVFVTVMFETAKALDQVDEIASMDGIDALTIGPADLAQDLGIADSPDRSRILDEKRDLVLQAAQRYGKTCAMLVADARQAQIWKSKGALLLAFSTDVDLLYDSVESKVRQIKG